MAEIRFKNLPKLLNNLEKNEWIIDVFDFVYKTVHYTVILKLYTKENDKPEEYAVASLEFFYENDLNHSIKAYIDFYEVHFFSQKEFCEFFDVKRTDANRNLFLDFSNAFAQFIPEKRNIRPTPAQNDIMKRRCEDKSPNAIYCYDVRRNGKKENGEQKYRTIENSNKAYLACPIAYEKIKDDKTFSFYFSENPSDEKDDAELLIIYKSRHL